MSKVFAKDVAEWVKLFLEVGAPFGALVILWYCFNIGYFPQGLTLGDALYFVIVSIMYAFVFSLINLSLFSMGKLVFYPISFVLNRLPGERLTHARQLVGVVCGLFTPLPTLVFSAIGVGVVAGYWSVKGPEVVWVAGTAIVLAYLAGEYLVSSKKLVDINERLKDFVEVNGGEEKGDIERKADGLKMKKLIFGFVFVIWPIVLGGLSESFLNGAIGLSHLRVNEATVYIKQPYCEIAKEYFPTQYKYTKDEKFCELTNMAIPFHGIGTNMIIAGVNEQDNYLSIPSKEVVIKPSSNRFMQPVSSGGG